MGNTTLKKSFRILLCLIFSLVSTQSMAVTATVKGSLPSALVECSGLDFSGSSSFWTHNDGFGDNHIYRISTTGVLQQTLTITGATNYDWEDMTHDVNRNNLFIGDFGNNNCNRTNLCIYKIPYPNSSIASTSAEVIRFSYPDQHTIPSAWLNFDVESFLHYNGNLYLFTKTDGSAIGYTKMYTVPDVAGTYVATLVDSFYTNDRTTSADISPDGTSMIMMSNSHLHIFRNFSGANFFSGQHTQVNISGSWSQKEALAFTSNNEIYMTDENNGSGNFLYYLSLASYIPAGTTAVSEVESTNVSVYPNPATDLLHFDLSKQFHSVNIQLYDITGKMVNTYNFENSQQVVMNVDKLSPGIYFYKLLVEGKLVKTERVIVQ